MEVVSIPLACVGSILVTEHTENMNLLGVDNVLEMSPNSSRLRNEDFDPDPESELATLIRVRLCNFAKN